MSAGFFSVILSTEASYSISTQIFPVSFGDLAPPCATFIYINTEMVLVTKQLICLSRVKSSQ